MIIQRIKMANSYVTFDFILTTRGHLYEVIAEKPVYFIETNYCKPT